MSWGVSARDAGLAMAARMATDCRHASIDSVQILSGEVVAAICVDCLRELPASWVHAET